MVNGIGDDCGHADQEMNPIAQQETKMKTQIDPRDLSFRTLTDAELDAVNGGVLPFILAAVYGFCAGATGAACVRAAMLP